ncbi:hypothetical protein DL771_005261 [Monosporascus sp. 5C6A]|nr:hypothetical protein DL771_005261 [Monosporascus sp. 5C6A]
MPDQKIDLYHFCPNCQRRRGLPDRCHGEVMPVYLSHILKRVMGKGGVGPFHKLPGVALEELMAWWWRKMRTCSLDGWEHAEWREAFEFWANFAVATLDDLDLREAYRRLKSDRLIDLGTDDTAYLPVDEADRVAKVLEKTYRSRYPSNSLPWLKDL